MDTPAGRTIRWSQPEVLLYSNDRTYDSGRISYPGLLQEEGRFYLFETQKTEARWHEIDRRLLEALWRQHESRQPVPDKPLLEIRPPARDAPMPRLPPIAEGNGFSIELAFTLEQLKDGQVLFDSREADGRGVRIDIHGGSTRLRLDDGRHPAEWSTDAGLLAPGRRHHVVFIVDGGPKIISVVVDGRLCDGEPERRFGWMHLGTWDAKTRRVQDLPAESGGRRARIGEAVQLLRIHARPLLISEAIAQWRSQR